MVFVNLLRTRMGFQAFAAALVSLALTAIIAVSLTLTDGHLVYSLDDPYIHLAVAESILEGGYGINTDHYSSPSSSILYPVLLAGLLGIGLGDWSPLFLNVLAALAVTWLCAGVLWTKAVDEAGPFAALWAAALLPLLIVSMNLIGLPMTGMEHTLHMLASLGVLAGFLSVAPHKPLPWILVGGIVLAPLLRFEGAAISLAALVALLFLGRTREAAVLSIILGTLFAAYALLMHSLGLPVLPSSVMVKADVVSSAVDGNLLSALFDVTKNFIFTFALSRYGALFALGVIMLAWAGARTNEGPRNRIVYGVSAFTLLAHLALGKFGWFGCYELYAIAVLVFSLTVAYGGHLSDRGVTWLRGLAAAFALALLCAPYAVVTAQTPSASENIYAQQFQMHRFASDFFPYNVAANDLGYVSFQNENFVLDLWGLGSESARVLRDQNQLDAEAVDQLTTDADIKFAMIYRDFFVDAIPQHWCLVAILHTPKVTAARGEVHFYLIDLNRRAEMHRALELFEVSLPEVSSLEILPSCSG